MTVPAGQELPRMGVSEPRVSEQRALRGSAPRQLALLNLHLDILLFEQKETFTLLKCSTPETSIFCTSWIKWKIRDGQGGCWRGCAVTESCV